MDDGRELNGRFGMSWLNVNLGYDVTVLWTPSLTAGIWCFLNTFVPFGLSKVLTPTSKVLVTLLYI